MNGPSTIKPRPVMTVNELERARMMRHLGKILDDPGHPSHLQLLAIGEIAVAVDLHTGRDGA